jgi:hypothetical protein
MEKSPMRAAHHFRLALAAGVIVCSSACSKKEEPAPAPPPVAPVVFRVTSVDLGKGITADKMVANSTSDFSPRDTIYVSVATEGASAAASLKARWTFEDGQVVDETTQSVAPTGPARTEFHISKPSGWPVGKYKVEITLDGGLAGSKDFEVKRS